MINKIIKYYRKRMHIRYVRGCVCELHNKIFHNAIHGNIHPSHGSIYKKWSRYLRILEL
jgi:hypothetical protein